MAEAEERRIAVVTGGNRGMGFETCRQLARRGYKVILASRESARGEAAAASLREESGLDVEPFRLDLTRAEDIASLVAHARRRLGRVDVLVNNAGLYLEFAGSSVGDRTSVFEAQMQVVRAIVETNLFGPFALSQALVAMMRDRGYGRVVNVTSAMAAKIAEMRGGEVPSAASDSELHTTVTKLFDMLLTALGGKLLDRLGAMTGAKLKLAAGWSDEVRQMTKHVYDALQNDGAVDEKTVTQVGWIANHWVLGATMSTMATYGYDLVVVQGVQAGQLVKPNGSDPGIIFPIRPQVA